MNKEKIKEYVEKGGVHCPFCHAEYSVMTIGHFEADGGHGYQDVQCEKCGKI